MAEDLYAILGVSPTASPDEIRRAYRKLVRKHHPDVNPGDDSAEQRFKQIAAAYAVLSDPDKRRAYDDERDRRAGWHPFNEDHFGFGAGDLFGDLFRRERGPTRPQRGQDLVVRVEVDLAQAIRGARMQLHVPVPEACTRCRGMGAQPGSSPTTCSACGGAGKRVSARRQLRVAVTCGACGGTGVFAVPCMQCGGRGAMPSERPVGVRIPQGAEDGSLLRVPGQGMPGELGGGAGDLLVEVRVRPHPYFRREGLDLHLRLPIRLDEALDGTTLDVPTPTGPAPVTIPRHSQSGDRLRLAGKGVTRAGVSGDLYVELDVRLPDRNARDLGSQGSSRLRSSRAGRRRAVKLWSIGRRGGPVREPLVKG
jgi:molecular chaperone DnaJ